MERYKQFNFEEEIKKTKSGSFRGEYKGNKRYFSVRF